MSRCVRLRPTGRWRGLSAGRLQTITYRDKRAFEVTRTLPAWLGRALWGSAIGALVEFDFNVESGASDGR